MPYDNIPRIGAIYGDGSLKTPNPQAQPRVLVVGTGTSGQTNELYTVNNVREAESEFGAATDIMKSIHELTPQGAENLAIMRVGGKQGNLTLTDSDTDTLVITPEYRDDTIMTRYALAMSVTGGVQRIGIFDLTDEVWVYDSDEILVINEGVIEVVDSGLDLFTTGDFVLPTEMKAMSALLTTDFTAVGTATMTTVTATQGTDGTGVSLCERYAALNTAYHLLDFKDADLVSCPGVYIDDANMATDTSPTADFWKGPPAAGTNADELGYLWQYIYQGKLYTYFADSATYFTEQTTPTPVAASVTLATNTDITLTAQKTGAGGNKISITILDSPLTEAITMANTMKTTMNAHAADATEHPTAADATNFPLTSPDATDLASLITLVSEMLTDYDAHDDDAELGAAWAFHDAQETADHSPASVVAPTDLGECVTRLNDLLVKYNAHDADAAPHATGSQHQITLSALTAPTGTTVYTISEPAGDSILITVDLNGSGDTEGAVVTGLNAALLGHTLDNGVVANTLVLASGAGAGVAVAEANTPLASGVGPAALTHTQLTGETVPAAVTTTWNAGSDAELRECNFAHQLASFCELASTTWKTMIGAISFKKPTTGWSREQIATWVGELPTYTTLGTELAIDTGDNGTGLLGNKFLAGEYAYRDALVTAGSGSEGLAYGGLIKTKGDALPNGVDWPYGILASDEAVDVNNAPVDLGKHIIVTYDWVVHRNAYNGGTPYRGSLEAVALGKLVRMPVNEEPIGQNGLVLKVTSPPRIHSTQLDSLARIRAIGLRFEDGFGYIFTSFKTAAHPDSDYARISTIRSVNRILQGIRGIAKKYIGKPFNPQRLAALQAEIDGYLVAEGGNQIHAGATASLRYTRSDRILGRLDIDLRMVPPFSIERIDVTTTLAADESEL